MFLAISSADEKSSLDKVRQASWCTHVEIFVRSSTVHS